MSAIPQGNSPVAIRRAKPEDAQACGTICYEAFTKINHDHGFPPDFPSPEAGIGLLSGLFSNPGFFCVVADADGEIVGSNCLDERSIIAGVGPITVDPSAQNNGVGRALMAAVLERARERGFPGTRLLQASFHTRSLSLYTKLGFHPRELIAVMQGPALEWKVAGCTVRPAVAADLAACNGVCRAVHGHDRGGELNNSISQGMARVVERHGRITAYSSVVGFFGHAVGETNVDLQALIASAESFAGPGVLVPTRNAELFRWCLESGLRVVQPLTLMTMGLYNEPVGAYLPSILY